MLKDYHDKYKTQEMYDKAVDSCLLALKFVPDWFVKNEMIEKLDSAVTTQKVSKYKLFSGPYFPVFGLNTEIYGVNWTLFKQ